MDLELQNASKTPFREPIPAISHLLKFAFGSPKKTKYRRSVHLLLVPQKRRNTVEVSIRFMNDNKSLMKNVESPTKAVYKKV